MSIQDELEQKKSLVFKKVGSNLYRFEDAVNDRVYYEYYNNRIFTIYNSFFVVSHCNYITVHTVKTLNKLFNLLGYPLHCYRDKGKFVVTYEGKDYVYPDNTETCLFYRGDYFNRQVYTYRMEQIFYVGYKGELENGN